MLSIQGREDRGDSIKAKLKILLIVLPRLHIVRDLILLLFPSSTPEAI